MAPAYQAGSSGPAARATDRTRVGQGAGALRRVAHRSAERAGDSRRVQYGNHGALDSGVLSGGSLLAIGLFNSIMFPTIFSLACEGLGGRAAEGSGIICVAIVGGAIVPLITGAFADLAGLKAALCVPAICYGGILSFGLYARRSAFLAVDTAPFASS